MIMEYVEGNCELESMYYERPECGPWCNEMYGDASVETSQSNTTAAADATGGAEAGGGQAPPTLARVATLHTAGREHLRQMGRVIAFDCLIFNWDRLPCVWDNTGNPGNVMFNRNNDLGCIDSCCMHIGIDLDRNPAQKFSERLEALVFAVATHPEQAQPDFEKVRLLLRDGIPSLYEGLRYDITDEGVLEIQAGFLEMVCSPPFAHAATLSAHKRPFMSPYSIITTTGQDNCRNDHA